MSLRVTESFLSIQGETSHVGKPCFFIRLAGCNLDCAWCDTRYAAETSGTEESVADLVEKAGATGVRLCSVTGGEPLLQEETPRLVAALAAAGMEVLVETNGSLDISPLAPPARRIVDMKPPLSGMDGRMDTANLARLRPGDELKFVIGSRGDFEWSRALLARHPVPAGVEILFGALSVAGLPAELAGWILADRLPVRLQLQMHRILWPDRDRGV